MPDSHCDLHELAGQIKRRGRELGLDLIGIAPADPSAHQDYLRQWLDDGNAGTMHYLNNRFEERVNPAVYVPGAASVICAAVNYQTALDPVPESQIQHHAKVARYALGDDYHDWLKHKLYELSDWIRQRVPSAVTRACVDTAPVMEKELAARAGVGWQGKNTCTINERIGSWVLLGEIITTLHLPPDAPAIDRCGTCTRCLDACPTQALTAPYQLNARRCISYLTIERREEIPAEFRDKLEGWLYGCDICQEVCPWNRRAPEAHDPALRPRFPTGTLDLRQLLQWKDEDYRRELRRSAIKRVKLPVLQRNARMMTENRDSAAKKRG